MVWKDSVTDTVQKVRLPRELKQWLKHRAKEELRTLNGEIVLALMKHREDVGSKPANAGRARRSGT